MAAMEPDEVKGAPAIAGARALGEQRAGDQAAHRRRGPPLAVLVAASVLLAVASLALPSDPGYDPWSWLVWGREVAGLELSTSEGPAWKPLPVLVTTALAGVSEAHAPEAWLVVARAAAILATALAFVLGRRLAGGSRAAGALAALGLLLVPGWIANAAAGLSEGALVALVLLAIVYGLEGRLRPAFALAVLAALLRVEVWPFLAVLGATWARRDRAALGPVAVAAFAVPALWFGPELIGSGELLRSAGRALIPNPGAPALAAQPALATLGAAVRLAPPIALAGVGAIAAVAAVRATARGPTRDALVLAAAGGAWTLLVAAMSELGFSGEARYALPGVALVTVAGMAGPFALRSVRSEDDTGLARPARSEGGAIVAGRPLAAAMTTALAATALLRGEVLRVELDRVAHGAALAADLERAVALAGGAPSLLRCGPPYVGPYRGPMLAWSLGVHKAQIGFEPTMPGVAFRSRLGRGGPVAPARPPGGTVLAWRTARWRVEASCGPGAGDGPTRSAASASGIRLP